MDDVEIGVAAPRPDRFDHTDPSALTTEALERAVNAERDYVDGQIAVLKERLRGIDIATELLSATVNAVPTDLQKTTQNILRLMDERDLRVQARFDANEKLSKTESELNQTALAAALQAAKEASAVQGIATDRTIDKNAELAAVSSAALSARVTQVSDQLIALSNQVTGILAGTSAVKDQKIDTRGGAGVIFGVVGSAVGALSLIVAVVVFVLGQV